MGFPLFRVGAWAGVSLLSSFVWSFLLSGPRQQDSALSNCRYRWRTINLQLAHARDKSNVEMKLPLFASSTSVLEGVFNS